MNPSNTEAAARHLYNARRNRMPGPRIPDAYRPADVDGALAIQRRVAELVGDHIGGWKCSVPSEDRPVFGAPIFAPTIHTTSPCPVIAYGDTVDIEPEIAFVISRDLPARVETYSEEEIRRAIREAHFVVELMASRYENPAAVSYPELLAEGISNQGLFVGPLVPNAFDSALDAFPLSVRAGDEVLVSTRGKHPNGHPLDPLYWLVNFLAKRGQPLRAGQIVTTGSYAGVVKAPVGRPITIEYGAFGALTFSMTPIA